MVRFGPQVAALAVVAVLLAGMVGGCDSPARVKPWRHAPDPTAEAANVPSSPALSGGSAASVRAARDHTLRVHLDGDPGRLNPLVSPTLWGRRITLGPVFEPLIRYVPPDSPTEAGRYTPRLARSWRVMPDGLEIRIELEPGVKFHDGKPLSSIDVQFTLDAIRDPRRGIAHLAAMLTDVFAVELITPTQVRLVLKRPSGYVLRALAEIPIFPMHVYNGSLLGGGALVGTGPYKVTQQKGGIIHLTRFDKYWAGKAAIADIEFAVQSDAALALVDAKRGDYDIIPALVPAHYPEQANAPGIAAAFTLLELRPPRLRYFAFNASHPIIDDERVRHALALLVNRSDIEKRVFDGLAKPAQWPIWPGGFASAPEVPVPAFDPAAASKLLDEAGWTDSDKDGIRDRAGAQLRLVMVGGEKPPPKDPSAPPVKLARDYFIEAARRIGVVIEVKTGGESWVEKRVDLGEYDIAELQWTGMVDMDLAKRFGRGNPQIATSPRMDRVLDALAAAWSPADRAKLGAELAAAFQETWPIAGIVADAPKGLVSRRLKNVKVWDGWIDLTQLSFADP
jgi:peptide/nickel transport system substrate-binding protein